MATGGCSLVASMADCYCSRIIRSPVAMFGCSFQSVYGWAECDCLLIGWNCCFKIVSLLGACLASAPSFSPYAQLLRSEATMYPISHAFTTGS